MVHFNIMLIYTLNVFLPIARHDESAHRVCIELYVEMQLTATGEVVLAHLTKK